MPTPAYDAFVKHFLGTASWDLRRDGFPTSVIDALTTEEKCRAGTELLALLSLDDDWPVRGLGRLKSKAAVPRLCEMLVPAEASMKATIALALWNIEQDDAMADIVIQASIEGYTDDTESGQTFRLIDIIHCLGQLPQPRALQRLEQLKTSKNYLAAYNAKGVEEWYRGR